MDGWNNMKASVAIFVGMLKKTKSAVEKEEKKKRIIFKTQ